MDRLSDCVLLSVFCRSSTAAALSTRLRKKSYQLRTHITVSTVEKWLDRYSNLQYLTVDLGNSTLVSRRLIAGLKELSSETCERLKTVRIVDSGYSQNIHGIDTILPILEKCKSLELLWITPIELTVEDVKKLATLPTFPALATNPNRMYVREHELLQQYEMVQLHLPDCIKMCAGHTIDSYQQEDLHSILSCQYVREASFSLKSDININSSHIEELTLDSRSDKRVTLMTPNLTSLELGPYVEVNGVVLQLSSLIIDSVLGEARLSFINSLPSLTRLTLTDCEAESLYKLKCPSLTHLTVSVLEDECVHVSKLPASLKALVVLSRSVCDGFRETTLQTIDVIATITEELPPTVTNLSVVAVDPIYLVNCKHLKHLSAARVGSEYTTRWPDSITSLELQNGSEWPSIPLPRALRILHVECCVFPADWDLSRLRSLTGSCRLTEKQKDEFRGKFNLYD